MKICLAQTRPFPGDLRRNLKRHQALVSRAASQGADLVIFPELSLTGYEPGLAGGLAIDQEDRQLDGLQETCDAQQVTIGAGLPTQSPTGICISMVVFTPNQARRTYSKGYLHSDEREHFVPGRSFTYLDIQKTRLAFAICYELSVPEHAAKAAQQGATIYVSSVAKTAEGVAQAQQRLSQIAESYSMTVLMANCVGPNDNFIGAGNSSAWNNRGILLGQLDDTGEGLLLLDTGTERLVKLNPLRTCTKYEAKPLQSGKKLLG